jgi:ribose transport system permease protein/putative xylitol transport system permease protein
MSQQTLTDGTGRLEPRGRQRATVAWRGVVPLIALIALIVGFSIWVPSFRTYGNAVNVASQSAVLLIIALGAAFIIIMGSIDLSIGAVASLGGILAAKATVDYGAAALLAGLLVGLGAGLVSGLLFTRLRIPSFLVSLGMFSILSGLGLLITQSLPVTVDHQGFVDVVSARVVGDIPLLVFWALAIYLLAILVGSRTRFGRYVYAIGGGERVALISGVPVMRYKVYAFILSGGLAGLAGALLAGWVGAGSPEIGQGYMLSAIAAVVMGGIPLTGGYGGISRTLLGVLVIGVLDNGLNLAGVDTYVQTLVQGVVIIAAVAVSLDRSKLTALK